MIFTSEVVVGRARLAGEASEERGLVRLVFAGSITEGSTLGRDPLTSVALGSVD
ncbi:MAG: hypothetical protein AB8A37_08485 [Prochlorococcus sp.]|nr:hypothetical protein [Prochlorococcaceae cyanobacterium ETNP14_MAG_4]